MILHVLKNAHKNILSTNLVRARVTILIASYTARVRYSNRVDQIALLCLREGAPGTVKLSVP